jgi:hypothetical protein
MGRSIALAVCWRAQCSTLRPPGQRSGHGYLATRGMGVVVITQPVVNFRLASVWLRDRAASERQLRPDDAGMSGAMTALRESWRARPREETAPARPATWQGKLAAPNWASPPWAPTVNLALAPVPELRRQREPHYRLRDRDRGVASGLGGESHQPHCATANKRSVALMPWGQWPSSRRTTRQDRPAIDQVGELKQPPRLALNANRLCKRRTVDGSQQARRLGSKFGRFHCYSLTNHLGGCQNECACLRTFEVNGATRWAVERRQTGERLRAFLDRPDPAAPLSCQKPSQLGSTKMQNWPACTGEIRG